MPVSKLSDSLTANGSKRTYQSFLAGNAPQTPDAWDSISTTTVTANVTSVTISVPQTYGHLRLHIAGKTNTVADAIENFTLRFNGDTGANYTRQYMFTDNKTGTTFGSQLASSLSAAYVGRLPKSGASQGSCFGYALIDILDYTIGTKNKTWKSIQFYDRGNASDSSIGYQTGTWLNNSAISSIQVIPGDTYFVSGTTISIYGLKG
jgi:hypothetical protein